MGKILKFRNSWCSHFLNSNRMQCKPNGQWPTVFRIISWNPNFILIIKKKKGVRKKIIITNWLLWFAISITLFISCNFIFLQFIVLTINRCVLYWLLIVLYELHKQYEKNTKIEVVQIHVNIHISLSCKMFNDYVPPAWSNTQ